MKTNEQKYPGATDNIYTKDRPKAVKEATCEMNNNPRNSDSKMP